MMWGTIHKLCSLQVLQVSSDYGIDWDAHAPVPCDEDTVPPVCCPLSDELFQQLANSVDPLDTDSCLKGVDLYCKIFIVRL